MNVRSFRKIFRRRFLRRRMSAFFERLAPTPQTTILDVGGTPYLWQLMEYGSAVTLLNLSPPAGADAAPPNFTFVTGSGTELQFPDDSFDIAFSNSVIEHLSTYDAQRRFAAELRRVGRRLWIQTPARSFFIEPHLVAPFIHYLPKRWQRRLVRRFTLWGLMERPSPERIDEMLEELRLLDLREMRELFPDCSIRRERFLGLTKAYVAIRE